ncbi:hypothetical protein MHU86_25143 [Fragilaria crotonensis]|nr:hypothetical protein MHU86_25143 [Fragilaria crotonensis]
MDPNPTTNYGDSIRQKKRNTVRFFFQNVKGLTYSRGLDDYKYYIMSLKAYEVDIAGLAETNTCWQHLHIRSDFQQMIKRQHRQSAITYGYPSEEIDSCSMSETFQAGGSVTMLAGLLTSSIYGAPHRDPTGLGRWCGYTIRGTGATYISVITAYRTCEGNPRTAPLGSTYSREYQYFRSQGYDKPSPRTLFLEHLTQYIHTLQANEHSIILMMDANSDISTDSRFNAMISKCDLHDLHQDSPPPSTYIGSKHRRIDYIFGCVRVSRHCTRSGALSHAEGPQSDHRGLYVDISLPELFQATELQPIAPPNQRHLHTGNPELVAQYLKSMRSYYKSHSMIQRIDSLYKHHRQMDRNDVREILIKWDTDQGRAMRTSERAISRPPKKCSWSPALRDSAMIRRYWICRLREHTQGHNYAATFAQWQHKLRQQNPTFTFPYMNHHLSLLEIRHFLNHATKAFRKTQKNAQGLRIQAYEEMIQTYLDDSQGPPSKHNKQKASILFQTIQTETCREKFRHLRSIIKPSAVKGLSSVMIPRRPTEQEGDCTKFHEILKDTDEHDLLWDTVIDRRAMEQHLLTYNRESFRAAAQSPCGHGLIYDAISFTSLSKESRDLLSGIIPDEWYGNDMALKEFLASFTIPPSVQTHPPICTELSEDDVIKGFRRWRETTSTSPSGRHLGHYKALVQDSTLLSCLTKFLNIALYHGISIPRWSNATNIFLEKDPGRPRINRLRIIHLFEADFNFSC